MSGAFLSPSVAIPGSCSCLLFPSPWYWSYWPAKPFVCSCAAQTLGEQVLPHPFLSPSCHSQVFCRWGEGHPLRLPCQMLLIKRDRCYHRIYSHNGKGERSFKTPSLLPINTFNRKFLLTRQLWSASSQRLSPAPAMVSMACGVGIFCYIFWSNTILILIHGYKYKGMALNIVFRKWWWF